MLLGHSLCGFWHSLESANRYSFLMLFWKAVSNLPSHKANSVPNGSPNAGQKGGKLYFSRQGVHE